MGSKATPRGFPVITDGNNNITSGLRRTDGSLVPVPEGMVSRTTPLPSPPRKDPRTTPLAQNEFGFNKRFANQEAFDSAYQNYLETYKDDYSQYGQGGRRALEPIKATPRPGMPLPEGVQIGFGPKRGGYFYGDGTPYNPPGSLGRPLMGVSQDIRARRPISSSNFSGEKIIPTMEEFGATANLLPGVSLEEAYNKTFGPLAIQSPDSTAGIMAGLPQVPTPPGMVLDGTTLRPGQPMIPEQGPLGPGLVGGTPPPRNPDSPGGVQLPSMGPIPPGVNTQNPPAPIQPTNPVTGNTSPIGGSQQDFDAYMSGYVNDLINQRMKNVFGGIMSSFS